MFQRFLVVCSIVLSVIVTTAVASSSSSDSGSSRGYKHSTWSYKSYGSSSSSDKSHSSSSSSGKSSNNSKKCYKYKKLADKYLKKYYRCYNYRYYKKYVYYLKKYKQCKSYTPVNNCDKYKNYADKYLSAYKRCGNPCYYRYYLYYKNRYETCQANVNPKGEVCGLVFEDTNGNNMYDVSDKLLENIRLNVTDEKGKVTSVLTRSTGEYCAKGIAVGTASVDIDDSTLGANVEQVVGTDPTEVNVRQNCKTWEERNGYSETTIQTAKVCGVVYEDANTNGTQDANETGVADINVSITDVNSDVQSVLTNNAGEYCFTEVIEGTASVEVNVTTLPLGTILVSGQNPNDIVVELDKVNDAGKDAYAPQAPTAKDQNLSTLEDTSIIITLEGYDNANYALAYIVITQPIYGTLTGIEENLTYVPNAN